MPRLPPVHQCPPPTSLMQGDERQGGIVGWRPEGATRPSAGDNGHLYLPSTETNRYVDPAGITHQRAHAAVGSRSAPLYVPAAPLWLYVRGGMMFNGRQLSSVPQAAPQPPQQLPCGPARGLRSPSPETYRSTHHPIGLPPALP